MKFKSLLFVLPAVLIAGIFFLNENQSEEVTYTPRENTSQSNESIDGAVEYYNMINADPETGKINQDDVARLRAAMKRLPIQNSRGPADINFREMGPDNIAGRVRAIESDPDSPETLYAGGVSGWSVQNNGWRKYVVTFTWLF